MNQNKPRKIKVALYIRVSTTKQVEEGYSLEAQENILRKYAEYNDMEIVGVYKDEGISGTSVHGRTQFLKLMNEIESGNTLGISYVLVFKLSRFGRNAAEVLTYVNMMQRHDVNLISKEDQFDTSKANSKLILAILASVAEMERETILLQMSAGKRQKALNGGWTGGKIPYGYQIKVDPETGEKIIVIDEVQAELIRKIYHDYVYEDIGMGTLAKNLNNENWKRVITCKNDTTRITQSFIQRVLDNPFYTGKMPFGRTTTVNKHQGDYTVKVRKKSPNYQLAEGHHEAIIDQELYDLARNKREKTGVKWEKKYNLDHAHQLTGLIVCPGCNEITGIHHLYGNVSRSHRKNKNGDKYPDYFYYACKYRKGGINGIKCSFDTMIVQSKLDEAIAEIMGKALSKAEINKQIQMRLSNAIDISSLTAKIDDLNALISKKEKVLHRNWNDMNNLDPDDISYELKRADYTASMDQLYNEISEYSLEIQDIQNRISSIEKNKVEADNIIEIFKHFKDYLSRFTDLEKHEFYKTFIKEIHIFETPKENGQWIKDITLKLPLCDEKDGEIILDCNSTVETVALLSK